MDRVSGFVHPQEVENFQLTMKVVRHWRRNIKMGKFSSLNVFKTHPHKSSSNLFYVDFKVFLGGEINLLTKDLYAPT